MSEEQQYWLKAMRELRVDFSVEYIAQRIGVTVRQVYNISNGARPIGQAAVKLAAFHAEHCSGLQAVGSGLPIIASK
jgi:hypothetical protein